MEISWLDDLIYDHITKESALWEYTKQAYNRLTNKVKANLGKVISWDRVSDYNVSTYTKVTLSRF